MTDNAAEIQWYVARGGQQHGPISDVEMRLFVTNGHLKPSDLIWRPGFTDWQPATAIFPPPTAAPAPSLPSAPAAPPESKAEQAPRERTAEAASSGNQSGKSAPSAAMAASGGAEARSAEAAREQRPEKAVAHEDTASPFRSSGSGGATANPVQPGEPSSRWAAPTAGPAAAAGTAAPSATVDNGPITHQPTITAPSRRHSGDRDAANRAAVTQPHVDDEVRRPSAAKRLVMASLLIAMIGGSGAYIYTHKDAILQLAGLAEKPSTVPVVKAKPVATAVMNKPKPAAPAKPPPAAVQQANEKPPAPVGTIVTPEAVMAPTAAQIPPAPPPQSPVSTTTATLDARYQKSALWTYMKKEHSDWYKEQIGEAAKLIDARQPERDATKHMVEAMVALRRRNAENALKADTTKLKGIADAFLANLQSLSSRGANVCYGFISQGEANPAIIDLFDQPQEAKPLEAQAIAVFEAVDAGKTAPASHNRPKKEDYDVLAAELGKLGWSQADLQLFADPKALAKAPADRVCKMVREWFQAHIAISDSAVQERLLFETLRPVVAG